MFPWIGTGVSPESALFLGAGAGLTRDDLTGLFLAMAVLLASARILGELATRFRQPSVLGELIAGILLGPTILGTFAPEVSAVIFPATEGFRHGFEAITTVSIVLYLLVAGLEVDLSAVTRQGKASFRVGIVGMLPVAMLGFGAAALFPGFLGMGTEADRWIFAGFFATSLAISALPIIVKILMDLNLFRSDIGMLVVASAILRDIVGWNIFAVILSLAGGANAGPGIGATIGLTVLFVGFMLTAGRWLIDRILPWVQAHATWPAGVLGLALVGGLACAAFTEWLGIHAIFGAFIFGVALGDSSHLRQHTRTMMEQFVGFIFAPIFFASIGLRVNFLTDFDPWMTLVVIVIGTVGMVGGSMYAARWAGFGKKEAAAIGVSLNARGVMVIILGIIALQTDPPIIRNSLFVALVVMELINTASSGFLIQIFIRRPKKVSFRDYISGRTFIASLAATNRREAIVELSQAVCRGTDLKPSVVAEAVWQREIQMGTGLDHGMAVPHARIAGLKQPLVAIGISSSGIDFDTRDGLPTHLVFLILTPLDHHQSQLEILADIGRTFHAQALVDRCTRVSGYTEFLAEIKSDTSNGNGNGH